MLGGPDIGVLKKKKTCNLNYLQIFNFEINEPNRQT